jgi:hypothetical protein
MLIGYLGLTMLSPDLKSKVIGILLLIANGEIYEF